MVERHVSTSPTAALALPFSRRDGAETVMPQPCGPWNEPRELPVRSRRIGWLAWSLWGLTMALEITAIWLWLGARSRGGGYFAPQVFIVPGFATVGAVIAARRANTVGWATAIPSRCSCRQTLRAP
jgi:hypothetical protein